MRSGQGLHRRRVVVATLLAVAFGAAEGHHAWNEVDPERTLTLTGTVRSLKWENPHASLVLVVAGAPAVEWTVLLSGLARMDSHGVTAATVGVGRSLTIVASPARDEPHVVRANRILGDGREHVLY